MRILFIGGTGLISTACSDATVAVRSRAVAPEPRPVQALDSRCDKSES